MNEIEVFHETPDDIIGGSVVKLAQQYIKDYGIDGEEIEEEYGAKGGKEVSKNRLRLFCEDCLHKNKYKKIGQKRKYKNSKVYCGNVWPDCAEAKYFFEVIRVGGVFKKVNKEVEQ